MLLIPAYLGFVLLVSTGPSLAGKLLADDPLTPLEETVRFLSKLQPDQEPIDYLARIDLRTGRPKVALTPTQLGAADSQGRPLPNALMALGPRSIEYGGGAIHRLAVSSDGRLAATGHCSGMVRLLDPATGRSYGQLRAGHGFLFSLAISPDASLLATAGSLWEGRDLERARIEVWDLRTGQSPISFGAGTLPKAIAFSPDGKELASAGADGRLHFWEANGGGALRRFKASEAVHIAYSPDGKSLATIAPSGSTAIWDPATGEARAYLPLEENASGVSVTFSPDGRRLGVGTSATRFWDVENKKFVALQLPGADRARRGWGNNHFSFSPDGKSVATTNGESLFQVWDVATGRERLRLGGRSVSSVSFAAAGKTLISGDRYGLAVLWDVANPGRSQQIREVILSPREVERLARDLTTPRAQTAHAALVALTVQPSDTLALFRDPLAPPPAAAPERVRQLIADLESNQFDERQRATAELEKLREWAVPHLRQRLEDRPPLEVRQRVERLLTLLDPPDPHRDRLLSLYGVQLLEHIGNAEARQILHRLVREGMLTDEAKAALRRLGD